MATSFNLPTLQGPLLHKSHFLGHTQFTNLTHRSSSSFPTPKQSSHQTINPSAKFNLYEILGGRGLCNGEEGLQQELKKPLPERSPPPTTTSSQEDLVTSPLESVPEHAFEKELLGLTGGFPGGEKGLKEFIEKNPPPKKSPPPSTTAGFNQSLVRKPKAPELPLLMPGMIAIVKNPNSPYHMYCGIVQRITDGKAGVLFEGGNWDRLITFKLNELERREKGPPMVSPRSVVLEDLETGMAMNCIKSLRNLPVTKEVTSGLGSCRTFAVGGKAKKGKGGGAADAPKQSTLSKEVKSTTVVGANILKEGADPKILPDSEYPDWLWHLLDKKPALSELRRKNIETLPYEDLKRFVKLDNRSRIKENNSIRAKN